MNPRVIISLVAAMLAADGFAQGTFMNLGFELANVAPLPPGQFETVSASNAVPGWTIFRNSTPDTFADHNGLSAGTAELSILGPFYQPTAQILDGSFTVALISSSLGNTDMSIQQTGLVPMNSRSLLFKACCSPSGPGIFVNGTSLSPVPLSTAPNYTVFGVDISPFANQTVDLRFTSFAPASGASGFLLDAIQFSNAPVPEPGTWALLGLGSALFRCAARRRTK